VHPMHKVSRQADLTCREFHGVALPHQHESRQASRYSSSWSSDTAEMPKGIADEGAPEIACHLQGQLCEAIADATRRRPAEGAHLQQIRGGGACGLAVAPEAGAHLGQQAAHDDDEVFVQRILRLRHDGGEDWLIDSWTYAFALYLHTPHATAPHISVQACTRTICDGMPSTGSSLPVKAHALQDDDFFLCLDIGTVHMRQATVERERARQHGAHEWRYNLGCSSATCGRSSATACALRAALGAAACLLLSAAAWCARSKSL
jgi:hypothetical protein